MDIPPKMKSVTQPTQEALDLVSKIRKLQHSEHPWFVLSLYEAAKLLDAFAARENK